VVPGQRISVDGQVQPRPDPSYGAYLERIGVAGTLRAASLAVEPGPIEPVQALESVRRGAADALAAVLPEPEAGLAAGILIGLRDRVDRDLAADFTTAGVSHVVAISGWNIAIVAAAVGALGGRLGRRRRSVLTMLAIVAYVVVSGASPSVVRAAAMAGVVLLARESGRAGRAAAALGWAVTLLLLADPGLIADAGFQLSSLATAGLIAWATPLGDRIGRLAGGRVPRWLAEGLGVSLAAQAATLPVVLVSFGRLALLAPLANLLIVPVVPIAMAAGGVALAAGLAAAVGLPAVVATVLALPGWCSLTIMVAIARFAADVPYASATLEPPANLVGAALALLGLCAADRWRRKPRLRASLPTGSPSAAVPPPARQPASRRPDRATRVALAALLATATVAGAIAIERPTGSATVTVLDVGQGDAILVQGSRGGRLLVDGGPDPDRLLVELDRLVPPWDRRLDAIVLTHPHEDHVAGLALLLRRYRVDQVFESGMRGPGPGYAAWAAELAGNRGPPGMLLAAGDRVAVDEIRLEVLWPRRGEVPLEPLDTGTGINNVSIVLLGTVEGRRFLLTGDIEEEVDPELREAISRVDLLKVAHHGSRTASTDAFLDAVRPAVAVASAGAGNRYGHPAPATLARLEERGAHVFRTDRDGSVTVTFRPGGIGVRTNGGRPRPTRATAAAVPVAQRPGFLCAIPTDDRPGPKSEPNPAVELAPPVALGLADPLLYHRADDGSRAGRGRSPAAIPRPARVARTAFARRRRDRGVPRGPGRGPGPVGGPAARRSGGAAPRCRQGAAAGRSPPGAAPWRGFGRMARGPGPRRAWAAGRGPPGHATPRRPVVRALARGRAARGPHRGLRRQTRRPAPRIARCPIRLVATALPAVRCRRTGRGLG
jgi:competence protein ComEC